ncbi:MAG: MATE family efflux transporter [Lachnospiraceae bacterium]|nr:MATE family efflux transporter [Candidatus Fimimorpha excrementavium]
MVRDLTQGKPTFRIMNFMIPILLGNLLQQIYNLTDSIIVGRFVGKDAFAAVGSTGCLNFLVIGFMLGLSSGLCIPIAHRFGAGDYVRMRRRVASAVYISAAITLILTVITVLCTRQLLILMQTPENILETAIGYIRIIFLGIIATMMYNLPANLLRALGDSKTPLYFLIVSAILNIVLDLVFVLAFSMGAEGTAVATVLSQFVSGFLCIIYMMKKYPILHFQKGEWNVTWQELGSSFSLGVPMGLQFSVTAIGSVVLQSAVNTLGSDIVASVNAASKVNMFLSQPMEALGLTMSTYCGQNMGAGKLDRIKSGVKNGLIITVVMSILCGIFMVVSGNYLSLLFIRQEEMTPLIQESISRFLLFNSIFFPFLGILLVLRNSAQGLGFSVMAMGAGLFEMVARSVVAFCFVSVFGFAAICYANPAAWVAACVILVPIYLHALKQVKKMIANRAA